MTKQRSGNGPPVFGGSRELRTHLGPRGAGGYYAPTQAALKPRERRMKVPASKLVLLAIVGILLQAHSARGENWPQWRGPQRDGISKETGLLKEWPADGPKLLWQVTYMGDGFSTPAVVGDRLYVLTNKGVDDE